MSKQKSLAEMVLKANRRSVSDVERSASGEAKKDASDVNAKARELRRELRDSRKRKAPHSTRFEFS